MSESENEIDWSGTDDEITWSADGNDVSEDLDNQDQEFSGDSDISLFGESAPESPDTGSLGFPSVPVAHVRHPDDEVAELVQVDQVTGQEVITELNFSSPPLTRDEAVEITARIKTTTNVLYLLVKRAHAGKAYEALGYTSFKDYIAGEFDFSKVYAYRLLNQANVIDEISARVPEGTQVYVSEPVSQKMKKVLPELLAEIEQKTQGASPDEAGIIIEEAIQARRAQQEAERAEADQDFGDEDNSGHGDVRSDFKGGGEYAGNGAGDFDDVDADFDDDDEDYGSEDFDDDSEDDAINGQATRRNFERLYALYKGLKDITALGERENLVEYLPRERWEEFEELFDTSITWLTEFREEFSEYRANNTEDTDNDEGSENDS